MTPLWQNKALKSKFASPVAVTLGEEAAIFGLDDGILVGVDAATGKRAWKGGRYGHGQLLLREDVIVVQCEDGSVAFVKATLDGFTELHRTPVLLEGGKTWNPPCLVGHRLLIRNHLEMACLPVGAAPPAVLHESTPNTEP